MNLKEIWRRADVPIDGTTLALFRMIFGFLMFLDVIYYYRVGLIDKGILGPKVLFPYDYLEFITPFSSGIMHLMLGLMGLGALMMAFGFFTRIGAAMFFIINSYIFLIDKSFYNNHIYLFSLLGLLFIFLDTDKCWSLRRWMSKGKLKDCTIPAWHLWLLRFQFVVVYFYGGIAKLNADWLFKCEPMRHAIKSIDGAPAIRDFMLQEWMVAFFTYGGLIFDLVIGFLLLYKPSRLIAVAFVLFFNITNSWLFNDIGIFPFAMLGSTLLFFDRKDFDWIFPDSKSRKKAGRKESKPVTLSPTPAWLKGFISFYIIFQVLFPFRHWLLPNDVDWTGIAQRFSWRMKIQYRETKQMEFVVTDPSTGQQHPVQIEAFLHDMQRRYMADDSRMCLRFANFLTEVARANNMGDPIVQAKIRVVYNGHPERDFIIPSVDLAKIQYSPFKKAGWVAPGPYERGD